MNERWQVQACNLQLKASRVGNQHHHCFNSEYVDCRKSFRVQEMARRRSRKWDLPDFLAAVEFATKATFGLSGPIAKTNVFLLVSKEK